MIKMMPDHNLMFFVKEVHGVPGADVSCFKAFKDQSDICTPDTISTAQTRPLGQKR